MFGTTGTGTFCTDTCLPSWPMPNGGITSGTLLQVQNLRLSRCGIYAIFRLLITIYNLQPDLVQKKNYMVGSVCVIGTYPDEIQLTNLRDNTTNIIVLQPRT